MPETLFGAKDGISMAVEDRRIAIAGAACEVKVIGGKEERSISCTEAKAARDVFKVDAPHPKMAEDINGTAVLTPLGLVTTPKVSIPHQIHSHQKINGVPGPSSPVQPPAVCSQPSL
jgi:hypothetical protein